MSDDALDNDYEPQEWDSGPYCQHWHDPQDCDLLCKCGHKCCQHGGSSCNECDCEEFVEAEDAD